MQTRADRVTSSAARVLPLRMRSDLVVSRQVNQGRVAWVARRDVARLAVALLTGEGHEDQVYDVSGPHSIDLHETARALASVTGRPISYHPETLEEARASRAGHPDWLVDGWIGSYLALATGEGAVTSHTIEHVTGVRPLSFEEFLDAEPDAWAHLV